MRVLVVGGGGREHVLCWKLSQSAVVKSIFCVPGNAGIATVKNCRCVNGDVENIDSLVAFAEKKEIDLTVVGPEAPLVKGIVNAFTVRGLNVLGPEKEAAMLEGSKVWAKEFMRDCNIPTAPFKAFTSFDEAKKYVYERNVPLVVKADGLAAGKGVYVTAGAKEAEEALIQIMSERLFGEAGDKVIIEERLDGEEASILALTDGNDYWVMPSAQDHKAAYDGDKGPNTGGMGAYSPAPVMNEDRVRFAGERIFKPLIEGMKKRGLKYRGIIYAGLMITEDGPMVLEFNVRFGDPEAQVIIPRLESDLALVLAAAAKGELQGEWSWKSNAAVCVVIAAGGYPGSYEKGKEIKGIDEANLLPDTIVFHAGTVEDEEKILTAGGRVLGVTSWGKDVGEAVDSAYKATRLISFEEAYYRKDIAHRALK